MVKVLIMLCLSVSGLDLPDLWSELESPDLKIPMVKQPESFLPTVNQIENMADSESQGRNHWYLSAFVSVFLLIMLSGTTIMKIGPMLKECVLGSPGYQSLQKQAVLPTLGVGAQRLFVVIVFGLSLTAVSCSCFWAMTTHRLSTSSGLDWELYMALFSLVGVGLLIQAVVGVCRLPAGEKFAMSAFPVACATSMIPTLSDYFDTLKDVIFSALCLNSDWYFIKIIGICSWIYLVAIHVYFVFYRQNCLAELCGTYVPLIALEPKSTGESGDGIWSGTLLPLLYKQLTPTKRELLLWENVPQAGFSIIFLLVEGGSLFVSFVNLALPAFQVILAFALFPWVRAAMGPQLGKKLNGAMAVKDFLKAQRILEEADFGEDVELFKSALPNMHFLKEMFQVEDVENLNLSKFAKGVDLILKGAIKHEKPLSNDVEVNLNDRNLRDAGAEAIAEALKVNNTVTHLDLSRNRLITDIGAQAIAEALKVNKTMTGLYLQDNHISHIGAQAIAEALKVNETVRELHMRNNAIGDVGAQAIAQALKANKTLRELNVEGSKIGDVGAQAIAEALKVNKTVTKLDLDRNSITHIGAQALREVEKLKEERGEQIGIYVG